jgi:hypothetical protein
LAEFGWRDLVSGEPPDFWSVRSALVELHWALGVLALLDHRETRLWWVWDWRLNEAGRQASFGERNSVQLDLRSGAIDPRGRRLVVALGRLVLRRRGAETCPSRGGCAQSTGCRPLRWPKPPSELVINRSPAPSSTRQSRRAVPTATS